MNTTANHNLTDSEQYLLLVAEEVMNDFVGGIWEKFPMGRKTAGVMAVISDEIAGQMDPSAQLDGKGVDCPSLGWDIKISIARRGPSTGNPLRSPSGEYTVIYLEPSVEWDPYSTWTVYSRSCSAACFREVKAGRNGTTLAGGVSAFRKTAKVLGTFRVIRPALTAVAA